MFDVKNKEALDALLGAESQEAMKKLLTLTDAAAKADLSAIPQQIVKSKLDVIGRYVSGVDIPYISSTLRDRITSPIQKVVRVASRWNDARSKNSFDEEMVKALLDPQALEAARKFKEYDVGVTNPLANTKIVRSFTDVLPASVYTTRIGMDSQEEE